MGEQESDLVEFVESVALLLNCLFLYESDHHPVDLSDALCILPEVAELLRRVRERLPPPE